MTAIEGLRAIERRRLAVAAIEGSIVGIEQAAAETSHRGRLRDVTDAMRPGVVRIQADTLAQSLLRAEHQTVVAGSAARFELVDIGVVFAFRRVQQVGEPPG